MKKILCLTNAICLSLLLSSQDFGSLYYSGALELELPIELASQVHSLDDFIGKFNGLHTAYGKPIDQSNIIFKKISNDSKLWASYRGSIISTLMGNNLFEDTILSERFIQIASDSETLDYYSTDWHVIVPFTSALDTIQYAGHVYLKINTLNKQSRWTIDSVGFDHVNGLTGVEEITPEYCSDIFIPPSAHDNGFIAFSKVLKTKHSIQRHIIKHKKCLDRFAHLVNHSIVEIETSAIRYYFKINQGASFYTNAFYKIIAFHI